MTVPATFRLQYVLSAQTSVPIGDLVWDGSETAPAGSVPMAFRYAPDWLKQGFSLGADVPLTDAIHYCRPSDDPSVTPCFGFVQDHAPGQWVARLVEQAHLNGLKVDPREDLTDPIQLWAHCGPKNDRFGALNLPLSGGFEREKSRDELDKKILSVLIRAMEKHGHPSATLTRDDLSILLRTTPGLGGTRIKALVHGQGKMAGQWVLRVREAADRINTPLWTELTRSLAQKCGLKVTQGSYLAYGANGCSIERRFDRDGSQPLFCLSAGTLIARDRRSLPNASPFSYLDIADILNSSGSHPRQDLQELWSRLLFNTLTGNRHDQLSTFWFYRQDGGWRLAPLYAPCMAPCSIRTRLLSLPLTDNDSSADPELALSLARYFGVGHAAAKQRRLEFQQCLNGWEKSAQLLGADLREIQLMRSSLYSE